MQPTRSTDAAGAAPRRASPDGGNERRVDNDGGTLLGVAALVFGLGQIAIVLGRTNAAYLQARQDVRIVSISAVATKILWLAILLILFAGGVELMAIPIALLVSEVLRTWWTGEKFARTTGGCRQPR